MTCPRRKRLGLRNVTHEKHERDENEKRRDEFSNHRLSLLHWESITHRDFTDLVPDDWNVQPLPRGEKTLHPVPFRVNGTVSNGRHYMAPQVSPGLQRAWRRGVGQGTSRTVGNSRAAQGLSPRWAGPTAHMGAAEVAQLISAIRNSPGRCACGGARPLGRPTPPGAPAGLVQSQAE